jgi:vacuolar-type H+-ATPase subunit I/STV1
VESVRQVRQTRQETRENIERIREENRGLIEQRKLTLKEQLGVLQDQRKAPIVERIYDNLNRLNDQIVTQLLAKIDQIEEVLERVKSRTDKAQEAGLDVSGVREAIVVAEEAIENARAAAETQAGNVYEITIGDEASLRTDIKPVRDQLQSDLEALRQKVVLEKSRKHHSRSSFGFPEKHGFYL